MRIDIFRCFYQLTQRISFNGQAIGSSKPLIPYTQVEEGRIIYI